MAALPQSNPQLTTGAAGAAAPVAASHDLPVPAALSEFMTGSWAPTPLPGLRSQPVAPWAARRRRALSARYPGERLVIPTGGLKVRSHDVDFRFRPHSAYVHLTGGEQTPEAVLVLEPAPGGHRETLFLRPRSPRDTGEFFQDRRHGEFWSGRRPTLEESATRYRLDCAHLDRLASALTGDTPTRVLRGVDASVDALVRPHPVAFADAAFETTLSELRLVKDAWEVAQLQLAVDHTTAGFADVVRALPAALAHPRGERWIEGVFGLRARAEGNGLGYETIAASGSHACTLHWIRNDGRLDPADLLLLDAGVETDSLYTADITRTLPLSGRFSPAQRDVYDLALAAQQAGIDALRPGARFRDFHWAAMRVIAEGLAAWGVLPCSAEQALRPEDGRYRRYTLCGSGHMLGLDVHDCGRARSEEYVEGVLEVGQVLTVEPGIYLQPDDLTLPRALRGIGVRIEDDLVVTEDGARLLSSALPRLPDEVEAWMGGLLPG
ncbi:aminopeptidase P family protein [Streptacidiphilus sp. P02-A3a]|uniref:aminopeptidase P family protein n=1 Tax=Streptacidiphilus sp. P02-A3a TaxID=2704468 RepID=UPI0015FCCC7C|nr:aminopeptidase P family protein [Streptacidiphilus sp. P02-A3a]QMU69941.1 M24 family metallopeptidase [Streptacidiphilus sp. P02-A3a]